MPATLEQLTGYLDEFDLSYDANEEYQGIAIGFTLPEDSTTYRDSDGDAHIQLLIRVVEDGELVAVIAPQAWNVATCSHKAAVFEALVAMQARFKLLRFDYDPDDGEIRPNVELPLEDSTLTSNQFHRLMHAVIVGVQRLDAVIRHAMETGQVHLELMREPPADDGGAAADDHDPLEALARRAGGIDALERLLGGEGLDDQDEPEADRKAG
jgi:hypothetical protein